MTITDNTAIYTPSGPCSFAALKYLRVNGNNEPIISIETDTQFPIIAVGDYQLVVKNRNAIKDHRPMLIDAKDVDINQHVICIPIEHIEKEYKIIISIDDQLQTIDNLDWFMIGSYVGTANHFLDVKTLTPGWNILYEFEGVIPEWVQRLPKSDIRSFLQGFEANATEKLWIPVKSKSIGLSIQRLYAKIGQYTRTHSEGPANFVIMDDNTNLIDSDYIYIIPTKKEFFEL